MRLVFFLLVIVFGPCLVKAQVNNSSEWHHATIEQMGSLALQAKEKGEQKLADSIATFYKDNYLDTLKDSVLFTREKLRFICNFVDLIHSKDRIFEFYYTNSAKADEIIGARMGYAQDVVKFIINAEEVDPFLYKDNEVLKTKPNWKKMYRNISTKYSPEYANRIILPAKLNYYRKILEWREFAHLFEEQIKLHPLTHGSNVLGGTFGGDSWTLNGKAWDVFLHCRDKVVLKKALTWVSLAITLCDDKNALVQYLDTKANILYKLGDNVTAIQYEKKALALEEKSKVFQSTLDKMEQGMPTWPLE